MYHNLRKRKNNLKTINYNIAYHLKEKNGYKTSFGVTGMQQANRNKGSEFLIPEYDLFDIGAFIYTQKQISNKLSASGGLRFDTRRLNSRELMEGADTKFTGFKNRTLHFSSYLNDCLFSFIY